MIGERAFARHMQERIFIGRKAELERLADSLKRVRDGHLQVVFVAGEAGVGKSSLTEEFVRECNESDSSLVVATGQCNAQTGLGDPYLPFRQILTSLTTAPEADKSSAEISKSKNADQLREFVRVSSQTLIQLGPDLIGIFVPGGSLLARLPTLIATNSKLADKIAERVAPKKGEDAPKIDPTLDQEKIFEQYGAVLRTLSKDRPLILLLDDLQWADSGSLNLLFHLARELKDSRILLLGTFRPDDVALGRDGGRHPFEPVLNELKRYYGDIVIDLSQSSLKEGRAFTDALVDSEPNRLGAAFREQLFARTGAHALFAVELLRNLQEQGSLTHDENGCWIEGPALDWGSLPARVEGVIGERIARLPAALHETLTTASVIGYDFAAQVIARVQNMQERDVVKHLSRELERRYRLVAEQGETRINKQMLSTYRFSHALVQQYLYDELGASERRLLHGDIAEALEAIAGSAAGELTLQLARHHEEAGHAEKAIGYWKQAGDTAFGIYAHSEAIAAYTRALELASAVGPGSEQLHYLYLRRGRALELSGQFERALENYSEMLNAARACQDRKMELDAQVATSTLYSTPTSVVNAAKGRALSEETLKLAEQLGDRAIESKVLWNLLLANLQDNRPEPAIEYGERSLEIARSLNLREQMACTISDLGWACNVACRFAEAEAHLEEGAGLWKELGNMPLLANDLNAWLLNLLWTGRYEKALPRAQESLEISQATKNIWNQGWPRNARGQIWLEYGEIDKALEELEASLQLSKEANTPVYVAWYGATLCAAHFSLGLLQRGSELYSKLRIPNSDVPISPGRTSTLVAYALCEIAAGQLDTADATLAACPPTNSVWDYARRLAQSRLALARQDRDQAAAIAGEVVERSRQLGLGQCLPEALLLKGKALSQSGQRDSAKAVLEEACSAAEGIGSRRLLWQILASLCEAETDQQKAAVWKARGREIASFIAGHMSNSELRASFMQTPEARALL